MPEQTTANTDTDTVLTVSDDANLSIASVESFAIDEALVICGAESAATRHKSQDNQQKQRIVRKLHVNESPTRHNQQPRRS